VVETRKGGRWHGGGGIAEDTMHDNCTVERLRAKIWPWTRDDAFQNKGDRRVEKEMRLVWLER